MRPKQLTLKFQLLRHYGSLWQAADDLKLRPEKLSGYLSGRLVLPEDLISRLEKKLGIPSSSFLDSDQSIDPMKGKRK